MLSGEGITLADVYVSGGEVRMGTMRWEYEESTRIERQKARADWERRARELDQTRAEAQVRMEGIQRELQTIQSISTRLEVERQDFEANWNDRHESLRLMRDADAQPSSGGAVRPEGQPADQKSKAEEAR